MKKLRAWHKALIAVFITIALIVLLGPTKLSVMLFLFYILMIPVLYRLEKKKGLSLWQERIALILIVYPIVYLIIPVNDVVNFFIASLLFGAILLMSEKWKGREEEVLPDWEGEEQDRRLKK